MLVRQATMADFDQMTALIHATSKKLIEKNVFQWAYPCELDQLEEQIISGEVYILEHKHRLVGSFSIKPLEENFPVQIEESLNVYRMLIHPFYQGKNMTAHIFKHLRKNYKKSPVLMDCWAGNEKLTKFYKAHECLHIGDFPEADYKISVFQVSKKESLKRDKYGNFKKL